MFMLNSCIPVPGHFHASSIDDAASQAGVLAHPLASRYQAAAIQSSSQLESTGGLSSELQYLTACWGFVRNISEFKKEAAAHAPCHQRKRLESRLQSML